MQLPVLLGLAALWAAVLLPDFLRRRTTRRSSDSISSFSRHLSVLERSHQRSTGFRGGMGNVVNFGSRPSAPLSRPVAPLVARKGSTPARRPAPASARTATARSAQPTQSRQNGRSVAQQRRQDVIVALLAASLLSFLATLTFSGLFLYLHLAIDVALVAYVGAVLTLTRRNQARSSQVTYLSQRAPMQSMVPVAAQQQRRSAAR